MVLPMIAAKAMSVGSKLKKGIKGARKIGKGLKGIQKRKEKKKKAGKGNNDYHEGEGGNDKEDEEDEDEKEDEEEEEDEKEEKVNDFKTKDDSFAKFGIEEIARKVIDRVSMHSSNSSSNDVEGKNEGFQPVTEESLRSGGMSATVISIIASAARIAVAVAKQIKPILKFLATFAFTIAVVALCALIVYIFYRFYYPRICMVHRTAAFERYMEQYLLDVEKSIYDIPRLMRSRSVGLLFSVSEYDARRLKKACGKGLRQAAVPDEHDTRAYSSGGNCVLEDEEKKLNEAVDKLTRSRQSDELNEELKIYFKFYRTMNHLDSFLYGFFARDDIMNEPRFAKKGSVNTEEVQRFRKNVKEPLEKLRDAVRSISEKTRKWQGMYHQAWYDEDVFNFLSLVHVLHLMLNEYHDQITWSYNTRKAASLTLQFNVWLLYYLPYVEHVFTYRIPAVWIRFPDNYICTYNSVLRGWGELGKQLQMVPCKLAGAGTDRTSEEICGNFNGMSFGDFDHLMMDGACESYANPTDEKEEEKKEEEDARDGADVREGFLGGLVGLLKDFIRTIFDVAKAGAAVVKALSTKPIMAVFLPLFVVLIFLILLPLVIIHMTLSLLHVQALIAVVVGFVYAIVLAIVVTLFELLWVIIITLVFVVIWIMDLLTGGLIVKLLRCENLPDEWEHRASYAEGNTALRVFGTMCCRPCAPRFAPSYGTCTRVPAHIPDYCPQQQIMRTFRTGQPHGVHSPLHGPYIFDRYPTTAAGKAAFRGLTRQEKERRILDAFKDARQFYSNCYLKLSKYNFINRHICSSIDKLPASYSETNKQRLRQLCYQVYCRYAPKKVGKFRMATIMQDDISRSSDDCLCIGLEKERLRQMEQSGMRVPGIAFDFGSGLRSGDQSADKTVKSLASKVVLLLFGLVVILSTSYSLFHLGSRLHEHRHKGLANPLPGARDTTPMIDRLERYALSTVSGK